MMATQQNEAMDTADQVLPKSAVEGIWVHIVCYEDTRAWILGKIALRLCEHLRQMDVRVDISRKPNQRADINHHICYWDYDGQKSSVDTLMVTHIDTESELCKLKHQLVAAEMGICMSFTEVNRLAALGLPREKLCYVNPGHDCKIQPRKIVVGITTRLYSDGRKREYMLLELANRMSLKNFKFKIMGDGWNDIVAELQQRGIEVDHFNRFKPRVYADLIQSLDYYLYTGQDEGSMGFIDALAAGIPTIVTPQGYHLDAPSGITYAFNRIDELEKIFNDIAEQRDKRVQAVAGWTFTENARRHLKIWEFLLARRAGKLVSPELRRDLTEMSISW